MRLIFEISQKELVKCLLKISFDNDSTCEFCQRGKQTNSSFHSKNIVSTTRPLKLLHLNLFGPTRTASLGVRNMVQSLWMTFQDLHGLYSQSIRMKLVRLSKHFEKGFKMKRVSAFHPSDHIMVVNLKIMLLKIFVMKMAFLIIFLLLEHLNKIGLLKGRTNLSKKWSEPCFQNVVCQKDFGQKQLILLAIFKTVFL